VIEAVLEKIGVDIAHVGDREIMGYCPVHRISRGRAQSKPKWYMNRDTGAWICFTCGQRGSLPYLVELLDHDVTILDDMPLVFMKAAVERWAPGEDAPEDDQPVVDPEAFDSLPRPPLHMCDLKDVDMEVVERYNVRWDPSGKCWMFPVYSFDHVLLGWQEKSKGYFMNVPKKMQKSESLFGYRTIRGGTVVVVESPLDAMRFATYGHQAVATYGSFVSDAQIDALQDQASTVILAFDNDDAGDHAMHHVGTKLMKNYFCQVAFFAYPPDTRGSDPGDLRPSDLQYGVAKALPKIPSTFKEHKHDHQPPKQFAAARGPLRKW
jgi:hypothetical protein